MSGLGLLLFFSWSVCGPMLAETATNASTGINSTSVSLPREPITTSSPFSKQSTPPSPTPKPIQTTTITTTTITTPSQKIPKKCHQETIVCGILIIVCAFFLMTTFLLTSKVCRLSRRIRMLSRSAQLNSNSDFLEAKKDKSKLEGEDKEAAVLMSYVNQTNQELDSAATEKVDGKAEEDGQKSEEKNEGATAAGSTFSQPQEEAGSETPPAAAAATSSSEGTEEPQNQP